MPESKPGSRVAARRVRPASPAATDGGPDGAARSTSARHGCAPPVPPPSSTRSARRPRLAMDPVPGETDDVGVPCVALEVSDRAAEREPRKQGLVQVGGCTRADRNSVPGWTWVMVISAVAGGALARRPRIESHTLVVVAGYRVSHVIRRKTSLLHFSYIHAVGSSRLVRIGLFEELKNRGLSRHISASCSVLQCARGASCERRPETQAPFRDVVCPAKASVSTRSGLCA